MSVNMTLMKLLLLIYIVIFIQNAVTLNPFMTYTLRYHKLRFSHNVTGNYTVNQYNNKECLNGYITINSKEILNKVIVVFDRCNPEGINCEYFQAWTMTDLCNQIKDKNQIWSSLYGAFEPQMRCPIQGTYKMNNASVDINQAIKWYSEVINYQWKVTQKLYSDDIYIGSYTMDVSIFSYRKKKNH